MRNMATPKGMKPAEQAFIVTVGVSEERYLADCSHVLAILKRHGYRAAATGHESFATIASNPDILPQLREVGRSEEAPPPEESE